MKKVVLGAVCAALAGVASAVSGGQRPSRSLDAAFQEPVRAQYPETWFHIIGGNASKAGLRDDLKAISAAGISGIQFFHGQFGGPWPGVTPQIPCLSASWDDLVAFAADTCAQEDLAFKMQNCPGWSMSGGPWITPQNAMRRLVYGRSDATPGADGFIRLANLARAERIRYGRVTNDADADYQDICVLAFPTPCDAEAAALKPVSQTPDGADRVVYAFAEPVTVRTVALEPFDYIDRPFAYEPKCHVTIEAEVDGAWRPVADQDYPAGSWMGNSEGAADISVACDEVRAAKWRLTAQRRATTRFPKAKFFTMARPDNFEALAGWTYRDLVARQPPRQDAAAYVRSADVVEVTSRLAADGTFAWQPPKAGSWTILRVGHVNLGMVNAPAPKEGTGWECSKFDREGAEANFAGYVGRLKAGVLKGKPFKGLVIDSWECGRQTWGRTLEADFQKLAGYPLRTKLPALFGWVLDQPAATEDFLRDWRHVTGRLVEENYYRRMAELAHENGLEIQFETAFGDVIPGDLMRFWKYADTPMCEFWSPHAESAGSVGSYNYKPVRPCVSAAHVYGKTRVAAESFTSFKLTWNEDFRLLKGLADRHFARGVTHLVFHTYTHNPKPGRVFAPGTTFGSDIGTPFLRNQTWWPHMPAFTRYLARCGTLLEAGRPVVDVLWVLGDGLGHKPDEKAAFPCGHHYDYVNTDALLTRAKAKDGQIVFPDGLAYRVLWLPPKTYLRAETKAALARFEAAGVPVVRGDVAALEKALAARRIQPDVACAAAAAALGDFQWYHRRTDGQDVYFLATAKAEGLSGTATFRARGRAEIWNPVTGARAPARVTARTADTTTVAFELPSLGSAFVVFTAAAEEQALAAAEPPPPEVTPVTGQWQLAFPYGAETPTAIQLTNLLPWKDCFDDARKGNSSRARSFSGRAVYRLAFPWRGAPAGRRVTLDLGQVEAWAEVSLNGRRLDTLWCAPYAVDVTDALVRGYNELEVAVTSTWRNKLVYEARVPATERRTFAISYPSPEAPYEPSGLLGPVRLLSNGE